MTIKLIVDDVELADDKVGSNTFTVLFLTDKNVFVAIENGHPKQMFHYKLTKSLSAINNDWETKRKILEYRYGKALKTDEVTLADVFIQGEYLELLK